MGRKAVALAAAAFLLAGCNIGDEGTGDQERFVQQADAICRSVLEGRERGVPLQEQAVLFRAAHHSDVLEVELLRRNIPFVKYGGLKFLEAAHVKDLLAILRWADNPRNRLAAFRALLGRRHPTTLASKRNLARLTRAR